MKKLRFTMSAAALCCLLCPAAWGQQIEKKIGFMHFRGALQGTNEAKAEIDQVQQFVDGKNAESNQRFEELKRLQDELKTKSRTLNAEALGQLQDQAQAAETELKRFQEDTQREINRRRDNIFRMYGQKLQAVIAEYAQANGYDVIFLLDDFQYAYLDDSVDLTEEITAAYNQKHPGSGTASATPPSN